MLAKTVVVLCVLLPMAGAAVAFGFVTPNKGKPNECPLDDGTSLKVGVSKASDKGCFQIGCFKMGEKLVVEYLSCGMMSVSEDSGCILVSDDSMPYPECCPKPKCEGY